MVVQVFKEGLGRVVGIQLESWKRRYLSLGVQSCKFEKGPFKL